MLRAPRSSGGERKTRLCLSVKFHLPDWSCRTTRVLGLHFSGYRVNQACGLLRVCHYSGAIPQGRIISVQTSSFVSYRGRCALIGCTPPDPALCVCLRIFSRGLTCGASQEFANQQHLKKETKMIATNKLFAGRDLIVRLLRSRFLEVMLCQE